MTNKFIEQRVEALENELSELKLIVAQIRKPSTVVEEALANDVIEFEGKQYKKVDREAREGDVVIVKKLGFNNSAYIETEKPYLVLLDSMITDEDSSGYKGTFYVYDASYGRTPETVEVYELIVEDKPFFVPKPAKTTNQLRAEIIEKAKGFIEESKVELTLKRGRGYVIHPGWICDLTFEVNEKKRTVVAILSWKPDHYKKTDVKARGIAKCDPSDVFNEHIGKAIALGRALGLDVSEFEQAVQPTELVVGHVTIWSDDFNTTYTVNEIKDNKAYCNNSTDYWSLPIRKIDVCNIINDTNAIYEKAVNE